MKSKSPQKISKIFIANRGEIARRIALTAKRLGIQTVVIKGHDIAADYLSDVVSEFVFVKDETTQSYLNAKLMIDLALQTKCDSIHPGFGFLSENADFAKACLKAGLTWIGPNPESIDAMASKAAARKFAETAKVPCVPGLDGIDLDQNAEKNLERLKQFTKQNGYPVLLKAAYGGGGKGMRVVRADAELEDHAKRAFSEGKSSFGNGVLIAEKYLETSRHVEVQVLADRHGNVAIIGDRDCSLQRRHQKIIEEAPAPYLSDAMRKSIHESARQLAKTVGYDSTGTVEFIVDSSNSGLPDTYYFLEMNTRLQVEHCVTEEVFGLDLVEWQIRVARGEPLTETIQQTGFCNKGARGHSIECRIYAEDVEGNFFPAPGPVLGFRPFVGRGVRWEIGLDTLDEVSPKFDPMIAKIIVTASDRASALKQTELALKRSFLPGTKNNLHYLSWLCAQDAIIEKPVDTQFIARTLESYCKHLNAQRLSEQKLAEQVLRAVQSPITSATDLLSSVAQRSFGGTQTSSASREAIDIRSRESLNCGRVSFSAECGFGQVGHKDFYFATARISGERLAFCIFESGIQHFEKTKPRSLDTIEAGGGGSSLVHAPVPGKIVTILAKSGQKIVKGTTVIILESMKMQFEVKANVDGEVASIHTKVGDNVTQGQKLLEWVNVEE